VTDVLLVMVCIQCGREYRRVARRVPEAKAEMVKAALAEGPLAYVCTACRRKGATRAEAGQSNTGAKEEADTTQTPKEKHE